VESSCEFGIEPSGSMKCWETISVKTGSTVGDPDVMTGTSSSVDGGGDANWNIDWPNNWWPLE
jgi:hypothetical protein